MAKETKVDIDEKISKEHGKTIEDIQAIDSAVQRLLSDNGVTLMGAVNDKDITKIHSDFTNLVRSDTFNFNKAKSDSISSFNYLATSISGKRTAKIARSPKERKLEDISNRLNLEKIFNTNDAQTASMFLNQSADIFHICDEIESICAYLYQLDEAVNMLRDNILNQEQVLNELPFDIEFANGLADDNQDYRSFIEEVWKDTRMVSKLNEHIIPKAIKFGRYFVVTIPYSEIGVKMIINDAHNNRNVFRFGNDHVAGPSGLGESVEIEDVDYKECMESINTILDNVYDNESISGLLENLHIQDREKFTATIEHNLHNLIINDEESAPNFTGITEATLDSMPADLQAMVDKALKDNEAKFNMTKKTNDTISGDAVVDPSTLEDITGCFVKLVDPRQMFPINVMEHTVGYYYFENYESTQMGTSITDLLSNRVNFNDQNLLMDGIVSSVLRKLKYGDLLKSNNDFKSLILNCVLYAEKRQNPVRIKYMPVNYVTEFKTNCDEQGNGQPVLLKSLVFGRLYVSMLMFMVTTVITKSTDTEFYYLHEGQLSQSYEDQVADVIDQFRSSNVDISQILNGNIMHGNNSINKRYFMCTGTQDTKPIDMEVISGQQVDTQNEFITNLKKMAIGSTGIPALALDYMDEAEFATIVKMTNTKVMTKSNTLQKDFNDSITELTKKLLKYNRPNAIPTDVLDSMTNVLRKNNTINNNISTDELNNAVSTAEQMVNTWYKGQNVDNPEIVEMKKEELQKQLTILMSPSLPWNHIDKFEDDVRLRAILRKYEIQQQQSDTDGGESEG